MLRRKANMLRKRKTPESAGRGQDIEHRLEKILSCEERNRFPGGGWDRCCSIAPNGQITVPAWVRCGLLHRKPA